MSDKELIQEYHKCGLTDILVRDELVGGLPSWLSREAFEGSIIKWHLKKFHDDGVMSKESYRKPLKLWLEEFVSKVSEVHGWDLDKVPGSHNKDSYVKYVLTYLVSFDKNGIHQPIVDLEPSKIFTSVKLDEDLIGIVKYNTAIEMILTSHLRNILINDKLKTKQLNETESISGSSDSQVDGEGV